MSQPTFPQLVSLEPRLAGLLEEAKAYRQKVGRNFCANAVWYGYRGHKPGLRQRLTQLVGWNSHRKDLLGSSAAYDVAYQTIYRALPDCGADCVCRHF
jgi:hypothetical protein